MNPATMQGHDATDRWPVLVGLQQRAMEAADETELLFLAANETWHLAPYSQACVFVNDALGRPQLRVVSGLADALEDTPFTLWVREAAGPLVSAEARRIDAAMLDASLRDGWAEWWPQHALFLPLLTPRGRLLGGVMLVRDEAWSDADVALLRLLHSTYAHALHALKPARPRWADRWQRLRGRPRTLALAGAALLAALCFPVHMSVLAPAEIIALKAEAVAAPAEGVVKSFHVQPNQAVKKGDLLFSLDDTTLRNRREIAARALAVANADVLAAQQKAFDSAQSRAELANLQGRVKEKEAELRYLDESLGRIDVRAEHDGVLVYADPNDWLGKPVATGERIAQLAQPEPLGVMVWVPVADAISLDTGAAMRIYLQAAPLDALSGELMQTSYQASLSPDGIASYRIRGQLAPGQSAHIGLRGVAKVYGGWKPAIYWLLRRPIGAVRQWTGL
jgi:hypothetical protein